MITKAIAFAAALLVIPVAAEEPKKPVFQYFPKSLKDAGHTVGPNGIPEIREIQAKLHQLCYEVTIDGLPGPATDGALKKYQVDHDLKPTGDLDGETWVKLITEPVDLKNNCEEG